MATIAQLVVSLGADSANLRREFAATNAFIKRSMAQANIELAGLGRGTTLANAAAGAGHDFATKLVGGLRDQLAREQAGIKEQMFRGILTEQEARVQGIKAAQGFNTGLLSGMAELRGRGLLSESDHVRLVGELEAVGLRAGDAFTQAMASRVAGLRLTGANLSATGASIGAAGSALTTGVTLPLGLAAAALVKFGADADQAAAKFAFVFRGAADAEDKALERLRTSIPLSRKDMQSLVAQQAELLYGMGVAPAKANAMAIALARVAGNAATIKGRPVADALQAMNSGLAGLTRPLRDFGIFTTANAVKLEAYHDGIAKVGSALTPAQKALAAFNIIERDGVLMAGAAAEMNGRASQQLKFLARDAKDAAGSIGERLLPALIPAVQLLSSLARAIGAVSPETIRTVAELLAFAAVMGPLLKVIGGITAAMGFLLSAFAAFVEGGAVAGLVALLTPGGIVLAGLALLAGAAFLVERAFTQAARARREFTASLAPQSTEDLGAAAGMLRQQIDAQADIARHQHEAAVAALRAHNLTSADPDLGVSGRTLGSLQELRERLRIVNDEIARRQTVADAAAASDAALAAQTAKVNAAFTALDKAPTGDPFEGLKKQVAATEELNKLGLVSDGLWDRQVALVLQIEAAMKRMHGAETFSPAFAELEKMRQSLLASEIVTAKLHREVGLSDPRAVVPIASQLQLQAPVLPAQVEVKAVLSGGSGVLGYIGDLVKRPLVDLATSSEAANRALYGIKVGAEAVGQALLGAGRRVLSALNPLNILGTVFDQVLRNLAPTLTVLEKPLALLAQVVNEVLAPVMEALAPVIEALIPPVRAIFQVLTPILVALVPVFNALAIILEALFPIIKLVAIAFTYVAQYVLISAGVFAKAVGAIIHGFGEIVLTIAKAIDKLPGVSAKGAINFAKGIVKFGDDLSRAGSEFFKSASEMAQARKEIEGVAIDHTATSLDGLATTADSVTAALRNVPTGFKVQAARFAAMEAILLGTGAGPSAPPDVRPNIPATSPTIPGGSGGAGIGGAEAQAGVTHVYQFGQGAIVVQAADKTGDELLESVATAAKKKAKATTGNAADAPLMLAY